MTKQVSKKLGISAIQKIPSYKMDILNRIVESDKLTKLLKYDSSDALFRPSLGDDRYSLIYDRVYPFRFVPETVETQGSWITIGTNGFTRYQQGYDIYDDYQSGEVYFYIFTHVGLMRTDSGVRQDLMLAEIDNLFDGYAGVGGMGELKLRYMNEMWIHNNKFGGYTVSFTVVDLK